VLDWLRDSILNENREEFRTALENLRHQLVYPNTKRAVASAIRADSKETAAIWQANAAIEQAPYGNATEARNSAAESLKLAPTSQGIESEAALASAMAGDTARAESLALDLGKRFPLDSQMQSLWLPAIQAQSALNSDRKNPALALNTLQAATPIELG
jgi:tetratricopeptide (TPR) repeat protein